MLADSMCNKGDSVAGAACAVLLARRSTDSPLTSYVLSGQKLALMLLKIFAPITAGPKTPSSKCEIPTKGCKRGLPLSV